MLPVDQRFLQHQRHLRGLLLDDAGAVRWRPGRDLVAELLLYLDDAPGCWQRVTGWLREVLDADRVDGGFGGYTGGTAARDYVVLAEAQRDDLPLPSQMGQVFAARDPGLMSVWSDERLTAIPDVADAPQLPAALRERLRSAGTRAKLALPLRAGPQPVGILCADWHRSAPQWRAETCRQAWRFCQDALGPVLSACADLHRAQPDPAASLPGWSRLTVAEQRVARLVATGMSYKEVARTLDRSLSTVDHQLRSIRHKLDTHSTARLVRLLSQHLPATTAQIRTGH